MSRQVVMVHDRTCRAVATLAVAATLAAGAVPAVAAELSPADKDRVTRLEGFMKAIEQVTVDRDAGAPLREVDGRQAGSKSELHVRLLTAVAGFQNGDKDGVVIFPLQASGYTFTFDPRKPEPDRTIGSDFKEARVVIAGVRGADRPKARIDLPQFDHGSTFDAWTLVHDEIQALVEGWFPEAEIEGRRRLWEKEFEIKNETDEKLTVRLFHRTQVHDPKARAFTWVWKPAAPPDGKPLEFTVNPGAVVRASGTSGSRGAITAGSVCVWAAGEGGSRWDEHRAVPLELVAADPAFGGQRLYHAERPEVYTHVIRPLPGPRVFAERVLEFVNETAEPLQVRLRHSTGSDGSFAWQSRDFALEPGQSLRPQDAAGLQLRAAAIVVTAESPNLRFGGESSAPVFLVAEAGGRRAYKADRIGTYRHVFRPPAATGGRTAVVNAAGIPVQDGTKVVGTVSRGQSFAIEETNGDWVRVTLPEAAGGKTGWIQRRHLDIRESRPRAAPAGTTRQAVTVTRDGVDLKVGSHAIMRLERGQRFEVLEEQDGWYRIAVRTPAGIRQGWVQRQLVSVVPEARP